MPIQNCPIEIPEGWEFVRYGVPSGDDTFLDEDGAPNNCPAGCVAPWVIIRRAKPPLEVGDWVRVVHPGGHTDGKRGVVQEIPGNEVASYRAHLKGVGSLYYQREHLIKQDHKIEPYTIDQCIAEIATRESRDVIRGGEPTEIVTIYSNGVSTDKPYAGFVSYGSAAKAINWPNGDAFGIMKWEDAE